MIAPAELRVYWPAVRFAAARRRRWVSALVAAALYAVVLAGNPLLHHDFACHQRTPAHCDACLAAPLAPRAVEVALPSPPRLPPAETVEATDRKLVRAPFANLSRGRSPPA